MAGLYSKLNSSTYCISSVVRQSFSFENNPKGLDPSRSLGLFRKGKIGIIAKFHTPDLVI